MTHCVASLFLVTACQISVCGEENSGVILTPIFYFTLLQLLYHDYGLFWRAAHGSC